MTEQELISQLNSEVETRSITAYQIAKKTKISQTTVLRCLSGESSPSIKNLILIAEALGLKIELKKI